MSPPLPPPAVRLCSRERSRSRDRGGRPAEDDRPRRAVGGDGDGSGREFPVRDHVDDHSAGGSRRGSSGAAANDVPSGDVVPPPHAGDGDHADNL